jgi:membrane-associated phospholipid phosphatase
MNNDSDDMSTSRNSPWRIAASSPLATSCAIAFLALMVVSTTARAQDRFAGDERIFANLFSTSELSRIDLQPPDCAAALVFPAGIPPGDTAPADLSAAAPDTAHPAPKHSGLGALVSETGTDFVAFPRRKSTWVILGIGGAAAALAHPLDDYVEDHIAGSKTVGRIFAPGKWIGAVYVQAGVATGLYLVGRYVLPHAEGERKTNKVSHLGFDLLRSIVVSQTITQAIKVTVRRDRPTGECCAFPSGHASATFATASVLERHLGYRGAWPTFVVAAYVSASRLHDNRHFLSDVLFGGAVGIASGWTVVGRHGRSQFALTPVPIRGGVMVTASPLGRHHG